MPFDGETRSKRLRATETLRELAEFMETLAPEQVDLRTVHRACGSAHCAWGWGETIGLMPRPAEGEDDAAWAHELATAEAGSSALFGLDADQFRHCFGMGYQFRGLGRPYTPADVARHLRETAAVLERGG